ncbi:c-type cytochrome [Massilia sp. W12]|uniref:c-type cytochrome n=1 Tax=Massilia sp. W12 TaxID=3126507 RepID=UPI0030CF5865
MAVCLPALLPFAWAAPAGGAPVLRVDGVPNTIAQRARACTQCHAVRDQQVADQYFPRIAGKPAPYLQAQMQHFRDGRRHHPLMRHMLSNLSDAYLAELAAYFASQSPQYLSPDAPIAPEQAKAGEQLALHGRDKLPACTACHGVDLQGRPPAIPGLLGLPRAYLAAQLGAWKNGARKATAPDCMAQVAQQLSDQDIGALTAWLATQNVAKPPKSAAAPAKLPLECGIQEVK